MHCGTNPSPSGQKKKTRKARPNTTSRTFRRDQLGGRRIDDVWAYGPIARHPRETRVLFERPFCTDRGDAKSIALSDHLPVMARFG